VRPGLNFRRVVRLGTRTVIPAPNQPGSNRRRAENPARSGTSPGLRTTATTASCPASTSRADRRVAGLVTGTQARHDQAPAQGEQDRDAARGDQQRQDHRTSPPY
jgi:hypothetical protein